MTLRTLASIISIFLVWFGFCTSAWAQDTARLDSMDLNQLEAELKNAKLFRVLGSSKQAIDGSGRCGRNLEEVKQSRKTFDRLKAQNDRNPTAENRRQAEKWQKAIDREIKYYKDCFNRNLTDFAVITGAGIWNYEAHRARHKTLGRTYGNIADLNGYIADLEERIANYGMDIPADNYRLSDYTVGVIVAVHGDVQVLHNNRRWKKAVPRTTLMFNETLRTGPRSYVRIKLKDPYYVTGQFLVNIGANSEVSMQSLERPLADKKDPGLVINLIKGALRAFEKNYGPHSEVRVRMGATICGIRGTDVAMTHDPAQGLAEMHLEHGDVYVKSGGRQVTLKPRTSVSVERGRIGTSRPLSSVTWNAMVSSTGSGLAEPDKPEPLVEGEGTVTDLSDPEWDKVNAIIEESYNKTMARLAAENYLKAMRSGKNVRPEDIATGEYLEIMKRNLKHQSMAQWTKSGGQTPENFRFKCYHCDVENKTCQVNYYLERELDLSGHGIDIVITTQFTRQGSNSVHKISRIKGTKDAMQAFNRKGPECPGL